MTEPLQARVWYFAYGSNLNVDQMRKRVGEWRLSKRAVARNYRLVFNHFSKNWQGYTANLQRTDKFEDTVHGVVYHISDEQLRTLIRIEGEGATQIDIHVELEDGNEISHAKAIVWSSSEKEKEHEPSKTYRKMMEEGFSQHGFTESHEKNIFQDLAKKSNQPSRNP